MSDILGIGEGIIFDITPDPSLFFKFGQTGDPIYSRVNEFVANSVDSVPDGTVDVHITVNKNPDRDTPIITVLDGGSGMTMVGLRNAFVYGKSTKDKRLSVGHYGVGLKGGMTAIGNRGVVTTWVAGSNVAYQAQYDSEDNLTWSTQVVGVPIPADTPSGTLIEIYRSQHTSSEILNDLAENLARTNKYLIRGGRLNLYLNGELVQPDQVPTISKCYPIDSSLGDKQITGWVGVTSSPRFGGIAVVRNYQEIQRLTKFKPGRGVLAEETYQYLCGEFHICGIDVNSNKTAVLANADWWALLGKAEKQSQVAMDIAKDHYQKIKANVTSDQDEANEIWKQELQDRFSNLDLGGLLGMSDDLLLSCLSRAGRPHSKKKGTTQGRTPKLVPSGSGEGKDSHPKGHLGNKIRLNIIHSQSPMGSDAEFLRWYESDGVLYVITNTGHPRKGHDPITQRKIIQDDMIEAAVQYLSCVSGKTGVREQFLLRDKLFRALN